MFSFYIIPTADCDSIEPFGPESFDPELTTDGLTADGLVAGCHLTSVYFKVKYIPALPRPPDTSR
jgi:hypothetical protein